jgi:hypothetical protein
MNIPHTVNCYLSDDAATLCAVCLSRVSWPEPEDPAVSRARYAARLNAQRTADARIFARWDYGCVDCGTVHD